MGCGTSSSTNTNENQRGNQNNQRREQRTTVVHRQNNPGPQSIQEAIRQQNEEEKKSVSKVHENEWIGEGVKKTHKYDTPLTEAQFTQFRDEFWGTRVEGDPRIWNLLKLAIDAEPDTAEMLLTETGITYENNSITICYGPSGKIYALPISIINLPTKYGKGETTEFVCINKDVIEQTLKLKVRGFMGDSEVEIENSRKVLDLKNCYLKENGMKEKATALRMFYGGRELQENMYLHAYKLHSGLVIQVMVKTG